MEEMKRNKNKKKINQPTATTKRMNEELKFQNACAER